MADALTYVYVPAEKKEDIYDEAQLIKASDGQYHVRIYQESNDKNQENYVEKTFMERECLPGCALSNDGEQDMVHLEHLNEGSLLHNLRKRFKGKHIYTYTGSILVSVNPYKQLPIYTPGIRRAYAGLGLGVKPPHVFAVSDVCYRALLSENINQSVLISGESGAGKTEAAKLIMTYLAWVSEEESNLKSIANNANNENNENESNNNYENKNNNNNNNDDEVKTNSPSNNISNNVKRRSATRAHEKVLATNPVLEAFGNAKTVRNDNSSRFGKMLDVQFDSTGLLIGAKIRQYLLEEVRVVQQNNDERNFHIFYYICAGADKTEREKFSLTKAQDYYYANQTNVFELPGVNSRYMYIELKRALGTAGVTPPQIFNVMKLMAGILWLGNIDFVELNGNKNDQTLNNSGNKPNGGENMINTGNGDNLNPPKCTIKDVNILNWTALMLDVDPSDLSSVLLTRENKIRGETFINPLSVEEARNSRDTFAKQLYQKNFEWLVEKLNENIDVSEEKDNEGEPLVAHVVMLLDIFGFEVFESNHFEQFCINFANERLQFEFNEHIFRLEQAVYKSENIDVSFFRYQDNKPTIHLIEKKPQGLLWLLDEQAKFPKATDKTFYDKICTVHRKNKQFERIQFSEHEILIKHYAGDVTYDTRGFLEKSKRRVGVQMVRLMKCSKLAQYGNLFSDYKEEDGGTSKNKRSVGIEFRNSLANLMNDLKRTTPHYVRCIKPNEKKSSRIFDGISVLRQLRCSGVLETIRIRQGGFPNRRSFKEFINRYKVIILAENKEKENASASPNRTQSATSVDSMPPRARVEQMCEQLGIPKEERKLGVTKLFLKDHIFHILEGKRNHIFTESSQEIQKFYRGCHDRIQFRQMKKSAKVLQKWLKEYLNAADPSEEVKECVSNIEKLEDPDTKVTLIVDAIRQLEKLGIREKNVDIIADLGGVKAIVECAKKVDACYHYNPQQKIGIKQECTRALTRFVNSDENATKVARSGAVRQMVNQVTGQNETSENLKNTAKKHNKQASVVIDTETESMELIEKISSVSTNMNIVIKENTVSALKAALTKGPVQPPTSKGGKLSVQSQLSSQERAKDDKKQYAAVKALGTITKHRKAARHIGRDEEAIETVLNSIRNKPKFGRLVVYSLNCIGNLAENKHNWESIVELGGIDVALMALKTHTGNASVMKECSRIVGSLANNREYAKQLCESGGIEMALDHLMKNPEGCGVHAMKMIEDILRVYPEGADRLARAGGLETIVKALKKSHKKPDVASALCKGIDMICDLQNAQRAQAQESGVSADALAKINAQINYMEVMANEGAPLAVLASLQAHPDIADLAVSSISCLQKFAAIDSSILELIKTEGAVTAIAMAMEKNPELDAIISQGTTALEMFADQNDLRHAMDIIARSRMETDSFNNTIVTEQAIGIVGNLALLSQNVDYIVSEGGISVFLSIVAGNIRDAKVDPQAAQVLASGIRAVGRLLVTVDNAAAFIEEGGIQTLKDVINECGHRQVVMNAVVDAMQHLCKTDKGYKYVYNSDLIPDLTRLVLKEHAQFDTTIKKYNSMLATKYEHGGCFLEDKKFVNKLVDNGLIESIQKNLQINCGDVDKLVEIKREFAFIKDLASANKNINAGLTRPIIDHCGDAIITSMKTFKDKADVLHDIYDTLYVLIRNDPNVMVVLKAKGLEQTLTEILHPPTIAGANNKQEPIDPIIEQETNQFLSMLVNDDKIIVALDEANELAQKLMDKPNDVSIIEDLDKRLIFISNICGAENKYSTVIDNGGLVLLPTCFQALNEAKECLAREHAITSTAFAAFKLTQYGSSEDDITECYQQMADCYLNNPAYDGLADYLAKLTNEAIRIDIGNVNLGSGKANSDVSNQLSKDIVNGADVKIDNVEMGDSDVKTSQGKVKDFDSSIIAQLHENKAVEANIAIIKNHPLNEDLCALASCNLAKLGKYRTKIDEKLIRNVVNLNGFGALFEAMSRMMGGDSDVQLSNALVALDSLAKSVALADNVKPPVIEGPDLKFLVDLLKLRNSPQVLAQSMAAVNSIAAMYNDSGKPKGDKTGLHKFLVDFAKAGGLAEIGRNLTQFESDPTIVAPAMELLSLVATEVPELTANLAKLGYGLEDSKTNEREPPNLQQILQDIKAVDCTIAAMKSNPTNGVILTRGVATIAGLAAMEPFANAVLTPEAIASITTALSHQPKDEELAISLAKFIMNITTLTESGGVSGSPLEITRERAVELIKTGGLYDSIQYASQVHAENPKILPLIENAINAINPTSDYILNSILSNIDNSGLINRYLTDIQTKIITHDESLDPKKVIEGLTATWDHYNFANINNPSKLASGVNGAKIDFADPTIQNIHKTLLSSFNEMSRVPEYYSLLIESGLVKQMIDAALYDPKGGKMKGKSEDSKMDSDEFAGLDQMDDLLDILNNLAEIDDGRKYLEDIEAQEALVKIMETSDANANLNIDNVGDSGSNRILASIRTMAKMTLNFDPTKNDFDQLISNGVISGLQNAISSTNDVKVMKEGMGLLAHIVTNAGQSTKLFDPTKLNEWAIQIQDTNKLITTNDKALAFCDQISTVTQGYIDGAKAAAAGGKVADIGNGKVKGKNDNHKQNISSGVAQPNMQNMQNMGNIGNVQMQPPADLQMQLNQASVGSVGSTGSGGSFYAPNYQYNGGGPQIMGGQAMMNPQGLLPQLSGGFVPSGGSQLSLHQGMAPPPPPPQFDLSTMLGAQSEMKLDVESNFQKAMDRRLGAQAQSAALDTFLQTEMTEEQIEKLVNERAIDRLIGQMNGSRDPRMVQKLFGAMDRVTQGNQAVEQFVGSGGVNAIMNQLRNYYTVPTVMQPGLHLLDNLANDDRIKTLLGMHNAILLILQTMRAHPNDHNLLAKCCSCLANLAYHNHGNMTQIIELSGVNDVVTAMDKHVQQAELTKCALEVLSNLCHNSDSNKVLICKSGGAQASLNAIYMHQGIEDVVVAGFRALGNLAFVPENVPKLVKLNAVKVIVDAMTANLKSEHVLQLGAAVLSNMAADGRVAHAMVQQGVINVIINVSTAYPDLLELQKSCLGCLGNLANAPEHALAVIEAGGHKRICEIMDHLDFEESIVRLCLQLMKMLTINPEIATNLVQQGVSDAVVTVIGDNMKNLDVVRVACQALCKLIVTVEASTFVGKTNLVEILVTVAKDGKNFANSSLMTDIMKVFQNLCTVELNAQAIARQASVPILRGMEVHVQNQIFLNVAATLLGNLGVFQTASRHLVKRGGCAVVLFTIKANAHARGILSKLIRVLANFVLTDGKAYKILNDLGATDIIKQCMDMHLDHQPLQKSGTAFMKAMKMKAKHSMQGSSQKSLSIRDRLDISQVRLLTAGTLMKKFCNSAKPRKRYIKCTDDLSLVLFEDPSGKKAPKQMQVKAIKEIRTGPCTHNLKRSALGWKPAKADRCFAIFSLDANGQEISIDLEAKTVESFLKWTDALDALCKATHNASHSSNTRNRVGSGSVMSMSSQNSGGPMANSPPPPPDSGAPFRV